MSFLNMVIITGYGSVIGDKKTKRFQDVVKFVWHVFKFK